MSVHSRSWRWLRGVAVAATFTAAVVFMLLWLAGAFHPKVLGDGRALGSPSHTGRALGDAMLAPVRWIRVPRVETAVGTIRAVHEVSVAAKLLARVVELNAAAGQRVQAGDVLARLDDAEWSARLQQAQAGADAARAARDQAEIELNRVQRLHEQQAAAAIELDRAQTALKAAEADLQRALQAQSEAQANLEHATIRALIDGVVVDRRVESGDTVTPGQVLLTLYDPGRMQLVASVRESLTRRLEVGRTIGVTIDALDLNCQGLISEIVPEAEAQSRSFLVKVTGPCPPGVYSGMFGRLLIPLDEEEVLVAPRAAVRRVGQLEVVDVADGAWRRRRAVQLGRLFGDNVEILSGLREGESVVLNSAPTEATTGQSDGERAP